MLHRARAHLRDESGNMLASALVGSMVMMVVVGAIAAGILGISIFQAAITKTSEVTKEAAMADATFRADILWASTISATDDKQVEMTVPGQSGGCRVSTWTIAAGDQGNTRVDRSVVNYPGFDASVNPVRCSGEGSAPSIQTLILNADPASAFTYANPGGRPLTFVSGTATVAGPADAPAGVPAKAWSSPTLSAVALDTSVASAADRKAAYRFAQTADNLSVVPQAADAPTHFVPEGNLTALP